MGLRPTITLSFAALALVLSTVLAAGTYLTARHYLVGQRENTAARQAYASASVVRDGLLTSGTDVIDTLTTIPPASGSVVLVRRAGQWYSSSLNVSEDAVPPALVEIVGRGESAVVWSRLDDRPSVVVGVPLPAVDSWFFEIASASELDSTLRTLGTVLTVFAVLTTLGGALVGRVASRRATGPLEGVARATADIAAGRMDTRLRATDDPDLSVIVGSFNAMAEALDERIKRDARFASDVSHELRSPVTTLMTSVEVMSASRDDLPDRARRALDLVTAEVVRLRRSLEHLLQLGRYDSGAASRELAAVELAPLVRHALVESHRDPALLAVDAADDPAGDAADAPVLVVRAEKQELNRALVNLFENADLHGGGLTGVALRERGGHVEIWVEDEGGGVPDEDLERIFERFARSGSRGSRAGSGLGLSLVAETAQAHGGSCWCEARDPRGSRFVLSLPLVERPEDA